MNELRRLKRMHIDADYAVELVSLIVLCYKYRDELNTRLNIIDFYSGLSAKNKEIFATAYEHTYELPFYIIEEIFITYINTKYFNNLVKSAGKTYSFLSEDAFLTLTMKKLLRILKETPENTKLKSVKDFDGNSYIKLKSFEIKGKLYFLLQNTETKTNDYYEYIEDCFNMFPSENLEYVEDAKVLKTLMNLDN